MACKNLVSLLISLISYPRKECLIVPRTLPIAEEKKSTGLYLKNQVAYSTIQPAYYPVRYTSEALLSRMFSAGILWIKLLKKRAGQCSELMERDALTLTLSRKERGLPPPFGRRVG